MTNTFGNGTLPLRIGNLINVRVFGGPYRQAPEGMFGVKLAQEVNAPCDVSIPTPDFGLPAVSDVRKGVVQALMALINAEDVYVGCMGGWGRTGTFLGVLAKVQIDYRRSKHRKGRGDDPVKYVRNNYTPRAIETPEQEEFVRNFDTTEIVEWLTVTQQAMGLNTGFQPKSTPGTREEWDCEEDWLPEDTARLVEKGVLSEDIKPEDVLPDDLAGHINEFSLLEPLVERDLDFIDNIEPDSAEDFDPDPVAYCESLQAQIDDLEERVEGLVEIEINRLTKPTIFERIRAWIGS